MEADLPLIEIAGKDDSLLQQIPPTNDVTNNAFSLSPLQLPATKRLADSSRPKSLMDSLDSETSSCSSPNVVNKENMIAENPQGPKLSMDPQQMKRKRRGGYNLRKSLAWDRAFFTEEGVLDPVELSMISGSFGNLSDEASSVINEELPGSSLSGHKRWGDISLPPRNSPARVKFVLSPVMQEDVPTSGRNRNVTKGCVYPRPLASSSLKRPANAHTSKGSKKDSKLPKIPGPSSLLTTAKSSILRASNLQHNQIARPALNVQKNVASESSSKNVKCAKSRPKSVSSSLPLSSKTLSQNSRENLANPPLEVHSLTDTQPSLGKTVDSSLRVTSDLVAPSTTVLSPDGQYKSSLVAGLLRENIQNTGGNLSQPHKVKPSGLRMPSPSLGYFGQRTTQPENLPHSATVGQRKFVGDSRPPRAATKTIKMVNSITSNPKTVGVPSSMQCSELTSNVVADKPTRSDMKLSSNVRKVEAQVSCNKSSKSEVHDVIHTNESKSVIREHKKMEEIDHQLNAKCPRSSDPELVASGTYEQLTDDNNHSASYISQNLSRMDLENSQCMPDDTGGIHAIHSAQASLSKSNLQTVEEPAMTNEVVSEIKACLESPGTTIEDLHNHVLEKIEETCLIAQKYHCSEVPSPQRSCQFRTVERADAREVNNWNSESHLKDEQKQLLDGNAFVENSCRHASLITDQSLNSIDTIEQFGENPKLSSLCITIDQDCDDKQKIFHQHLNDSEECQQDRHKQKIFHQHLNDSEECQQDRHLDSFTDVLPKDSHLCQSDFRNSYNSENKGNVPSEEDAQSILAGMEESADGLEHFTCKQLRQDMECSDQVISLEYDSDVKMIKGRGGVIIATSAESFFLREELTAKEVQPSLRRSSEVGEGGGLKITLLDETETQMALSGTILAGNFHSESDGPKASMDSNERASVGDTQHNNCMMIPLLDVHHSDENNCLQKMSNSDECQKRSFSDSALDECQKETVSDNYVYESDLQICFDLKLKDCPCREGLPSDSFKIESSADHLKHLNGIQCEREHIIKAIAIASNSNLAMNKDGSKDVASTCPEPCSFREELAVQGIQTSSRRSSQVGVIDGSTRTFGEKFTEDAYSPISKLHNELEYVKDRDSSASVNQPENDLKHSSCIIIPPVDEAHNSGDNHCLFTQNICISEECQQENMLKSVKDVLPKNPNYSSVCLNEIQSCVDLEKMDDWPFGEDDPSSSVGIESSADLLEHITDIRLRHVMDHSGQTEYDSALNMRKDVREDVAIRGVFTLSRSRQVHSEDISKWSDEIETKITEGINSPVGKLNNDLDDVSASGTDNDEPDCSKESGKDIEHERYITVPPHDALPFSDEWLAAMEAAGEDILTMKSGAVQNSPPEKSVPEPSPWSPVKRKNTGIGPFDCTKCTQPADLQ